MAESDLWRWSAADTASAIRAKKISAREAATAALARMDAVNGKLNAVVARFDAEALDAADAADAAQSRGDALGPLHGVPVTIKINAATTDGKSRFGFSFLQMRSSARFASLLAFPTCASICFASTKTKFLRNAH